MYKRYLHKWPQNSLFLPAPPAKQAKIRSRPLKVLPVTACLTRQKPNKKHRPSPQQRFLNNGFKFSYRPFGRCLFLTSSTFQTASFKFSNLKILMCKTISSEFIGLFG